MKIELLLQQIEILKLQRNTALDSVVRFAAENELLKEELEKLSKKEE